MLITDEYINELFEGMNFGEVVNNSVDEKRKLIADTLRNQLDGFWSGRTAYKVVIDGGFLYDASTHSQKKLTALGRLFMKDYPSESPFKCVQCKDELCGGTKIWQGAKCDGIPF